MNEYKNEGLAIIANKFPNIDFSEADDVFAVPVWIICEKLCLDVDFQNIGVESGVSGSLDPGTKTIVVNDDYPRTRKLFTVAHEIGHYVLHDGVQNRFDSRRKYTAEELSLEKEANEFAAELLMPQEKFKEIFKNFRGDLQRVASFFGVSQNAAEIRCFVLGLIDNV